MEDTLDLRYLIGALRRRWVLIAAPAALALSLAVAVAALLPPVYVSSARILVESQQIPTELARSTVETDAGERIRTIEQRLTTRQNLLELAQRHAVFGPAAGLSPTEIVDSMRAATRIQAVSVSNRRGSRVNTTVTTVEIAFRANRAATAVQVANDFLTQVLEQNVRERSARAAETVDFFTREVERLGAALADLGARVSAFKTENDLSLPENLEFRRAEFVSLQQATLAREGQRLALEDRKRTIEDAIALGQSTTVAARDPREGELLRLRALLAQQRALYAPSHPTIRTLNAQIAGLEAVIGTAVATDAAAEAQAPVAGQATEALRELERIEAEIALLGEQGDRDAARMVQIEQAIERAPNVENELGALTRERASLERQYADAIAKQAEAATGERLEINQQAERFEVIEQPQQPDQPVSPNRILIAGLGGVLGLGLGLGLAVLAELLNPAIRSSRDLERRLDLRPVVTIPYIRTAAETRRRRWLIRLALFALIVMAPLALFAVDRLYMPLPQLLDVLARRAGLADLLNLVQRWIGS